MLHTGSKRFRVSVILLLTITVTPLGCSRKRYRVQADQEAYSVIDERNDDPRWNITDYSIDLDKRSRYFDPYDPDCPPMPKDDPASQRYMRQVAGRKGWPHWDDNGNRVELENPSWRDELANYVPVTKEGAVRLNLESALKLAYVHSPDHQRQLETLYLSALDVTAERFRLDTQFFGGYDLDYAHSGSLAPAALGFNSGTGSFGVNPPFNVAETNRLTVGRPSTANPALLARRRTAMAGELLVGFANSFVFELTGNDASLTSSIANFSIVQPLLRGAGRDIALEQLTFDERNLLANLRSYGQFRQGFYTLIAIGQTGVGGPQRNGPSTSVQVASPGGFLGGYIGLLAQVQEIRNSQDNLSLQLRTLKQLEALEDVGIIDLVQVDQFRQSVESQRASLLSSRNNLELQLDQYKTNILGLPPNLKVEMDDSLIKQFQLIDPRGTALQDAIIDLYILDDEVAKEPSLAKVQALLRRLRELVTLVDQQLKRARNDLQAFHKLQPTREKDMTERVKEDYRKEIEVLNKMQLDLESSFKLRAAEIVTFKRTLTKETRVKSFKNMITWLGKILRIAQASLLVQARARLESVTIESIHLHSDEAFRTALTNRLDFMNGRAALVDSWRQVQVNADALQSVLNITASGDVRTARNKPFDFKAPTGNLRLGVQFDAPFTRLLERNSYREALIRYQQNRRSFIQSRDRLQLGVRQVLRRLRQLRENLEIQRRAVAIAIRRVDLTRANLYRPVPQGQPGQRAAQFGPTAAFNLLQSLNSLRFTQNAFLRAWLDYYAERMRLARELGTMRLDREGRWIEGRDGEAETAPDKAPPPAKQNPPQGPELPPRISRLPAVVD